MSKKRFMGGVALVTILGAVALLWTIVRPKDVSVNESRAQVTTADAVKHCEDAIGSPRVERVGDRVFIAIGYDLANAILVRTESGGVLIDAGMSPERATQMRAALLGASPGPIRHIIVTHSHIDHVGGLATWVDAEAQPVEIWATEAFTQHFFKQYGTFRPAESSRGARQFGRHTAGQGLPCSALGRFIDLDAAMTLGVRMPTRTFSGQTSFSMGGLTFRLEEAHGETHDQLFVHVPELDAVFAGDNWYRAFPNLYTIRGTSPRPVDQWIESLDRMRALQPTALIPSHTRPVVGEREVRKALTTYRDAIQWVRDQTVRLANEGRSVDELAATIGLPTELRDSPYLLELYGQVDWSVRAIYDAHLGWFDGRPETLYPVPPTQMAERTVQAMGGSSRVLSLAQTSMEDGDHAWALHLLALLRRSSDSRAVSAGIDEAWVTALRAQAQTVSNSNGRSYLMESAYEAEHGESPLPKPTLDDALVRAVPLAVIFDVLASRLIPEHASGVHESVRFVLSDDDAVERFTVTIRHHIAEVSRGTPLPGTPTPIAALHCSAQTWREIAMDTRSAAAAIATGDLRVEGSATDLLAFLDRFKRGI